MRSHLPSPLDAISLFAGTSSIVSLLVVHCARREPGTTAVAFAVLLMCGMLTPAKYPRNLLAHSASFGVVVGMIGGGLYALLSG